MATNSLRPRRTCKRTSLHNLLSALLPDRLPTVPQCHHGGRSSESLGECVGTGRSGRVDQASGGCRRRGRVGAQAAAPLAAQAHRGAHVRRARRLERAFWLPPSLAAADAQTQDQAAPAARRRVQGVPRLPQRHSQPAEHVARLARVGGGRARRRGEFHSLTRAAPRAHRTRVSASLRMDLASTAGATSTSDAS